MNICSYGLCEREPAGICECGLPFCSDHGSVGGDRDTEGGPVAVPSQCWKCGGFNADA